MSWFDMIASVIQGLESGIDPNTGMSPVQSVATPDATPVVASDSGIVAAPESPFSATSSGLGVVQAPYNPQALSRAIYHQNAIRAPEAWDVLVNSAAAGQNFNDAWQQATDRYVNQMRNSRWTPNQNIAGSGAARPTTMQEYEAYYNQGQHAPTIAPEAAGPKVEAPQPDWFGGWFSFADGGATGGISDTLPYVKRRN